MIPNDIKASIEQFWSWIREHKAEIDSLVDTSDPLWDMGLSKLQAINEGLWFELSLPNGNERELIITAESRSELFPVVEKIVSCAPKLSGWRFISLKPPRGFAFKTKYEGIPLDPDSMSFLPLERSDIPKMLGLRISVPSFAESKRTPFTTGVMIILETAVGERAFAMDIQYVEVCSMPDKPEAEGYFPLPNLPDYIARRNRKLGLK
jgi:hypothetical protein